MINKVLVAVVALMTMVTAVEDLCIETLNKPFSCVDSDSCCGRSVCIIAKSYSCQPDPNPDIPDPVVPPRNEDYLIYDECIGDGNDQVC